MGGRAIVCGASFFYTWHMGKVNWILLRGLGRESGHWGPFTEQFRRRFPSDAVLTVDYPGVGARENEKAPLTVPRLAQGIATALTTWNPSETIVVGHSLGGMVAMALASQYPDLKGLVLINTSASGVNRWQERVQIPAAVEMAEVFATGNLRQREEKILRLVSRQPESHGEILQIWVKLAQERPISRQVIVKQLLAAARFRLPQISSQTAKLVLAGLGDSLVNPGCSKALGERLKVPVRFHPWAGHELSLDDPEWLLTEVERWRS